MFYKLFINYLRLKLVRILLNRIGLAQFSTSTPLKTMGVLSYVIELVGTRHSISKRRPK